MALIHLDAGVVIGLLDADDPHHEASRGVIEDAVDSNDRLAMAASALAECLVGPARRGDEAVGVVLALCERLPIQIVPLNQAIAVSAARLRARHRRVRLPDALVLATAHESRADGLVTTDRRWPDPEQLGLALRVETL